MKGPTESYLKVQYELRPAKQVERRMLIDALHLLSLSGFPISDYKYTGFGSIYFVDFILFHKLLGIHNLLSVEYSTKIKKRVNYNKPYDCIEVQIKPVSDVIPTLSPDLKHILWLDYDSVIQGSQLQDIYIAASHLSTGSMLLITVDVEPPGQKDDGPEQWRAYYEAEARRYLGSGPSLADFAESNLPRINIDIIEKAIKDGLAARGNVEFLPLFSFLYADGHQMLTVGGMIGTQTERRQLRGGKIEEAEYIIRDLKDEPFRIRVPRVTRKERLYLESAMPCSDNWKPKDFEMGREDIIDYRRIYRFFPAYAELLL